MIIKGLKNIIKTYERKLIKTLKFQCKNNNGALDKVLRFVVFDEY